MAGLVDDANMSMNSVNGILRALLIRPMSLLELSSEIDVGSLKKSLGGEVRLSDALLLLDSLSLIERVRGVYKLTEKGAARLTELDD